MLVAPAPLRILISSYNIQIMQNETALDICTPGADFRVPLLLARMSDSWTIPFAMTPRDDAHSRPEVELGIPISTSRHFGKHVAMTPHDDTERVQRLN